MIEDKKQSSYYWNCIFAFSFWNQGVNRSLLHWLKLWDYVVFDKELPKVKKDKKVQEKNAFKKKKFQPDILEVLDKHKRPEQKVHVV